MRNDLLPKSNEPNHEKFSFRFLILGIIIENGIMLQSPRFMYLFLVRCEMCRRLSR